MLGMWHPQHGQYFAAIMRTLTTGFDLAVSACLTDCGGVFSLRLLILPRLASPVTLAVRADARDVDRSIDR